MSGNGDGSIISITGRARRVWDLLDFRAGSAGG
jgi:hypothetical protein